MSNLGARSVLVAMDTVRRHHRHILELNPRQRLRHWRNASVSTTKLNITLSQAITRVRRTIQQLKLYHPTQPSFLMLAIRVK